MRSIYWLMYQMVKPEFYLMEVQENKMWVDGRDHVIGHELLMQRRIEPYVTSIVKEMLHEGMTVVDIGANIGYYTLIAARCVGDRGRVYAFEPEPRIYKILQKNIEINGYKNVIASQLAVTNRKEKVRLFRNETDFGNASLCQQNIRGLRARESIEVQATTLDEFLGDARVDFIKMDTEGAEGLIIEGGRRILSRRAMKIVMEFWPYGLRNMGTDPLCLLRWLRSQGFSMKYLDQVRWCTEAIEKEQAIGICEDAKAIYLLLQN